MRRSISGRKVQTLRDRQACFTKEPDAMLLSLTRKKTELSFKGNGVISMKYGTLQDDSRKDTYMDLK